MKKFLLSLLLSLALIARLHAATTGLSSIPFSTSQAQFVAGDVITIQEVLATSPNLVPGTTVVVRGTYTLQSQASAVLSISLTTTTAVSQPVQPAARTTVSAGTGVFELEYAIQLNGTLHVTFSPVTSGSSFASIYFASGAPSTPPTPPPVTPSSVSTAGLVSAPFSTSQVQFAAGDAITITEVLASSPNLAPGDSVVVRGTYTLQSQPSALLAIYLTANAPGAIDGSSAASRKTVSAGSGTFELAYEIKQPGSLHVTFYPSGSGSSFGGVYFATPGSAGGSSGSGSPALVSPAANTGLLGNLSIRSLVSPGVGTLVAGVTVVERERYVLIRAVGPTLSKFGVTGVLAKPLLSVYNAAGELIASTGSWSTNFSATQRAGIELLSASVGAFALTAGSDDAVLHLRLVPGGYSVVVAPADGQSGVALMEIYASATFTLPPP